jgi:hypothetical protein
LELRNEDILWLRVEREKEEKKNLLQPKKKSDKDENNETSFRSVAKMATKDTAEGRE